MKLRPALEEIYSPIEEELESVEEAIFGILSTSNPLSHEIIRYFFNNKGKYLRPALCLFGAAFAGDRAVLRSTACDSFRRQVEHFLAAHGPQIWGKRFASREAIRIFHAAAKMR